MVNVTHKPDSIYPNVVDIETKEDIISNTLFTEENTKQIDYIICGRVNKWYALVLHRKTLRCSKCSQIRK